MALNLVGLGFTFGAEDKGALQFQKTLIDGFKQITDSMTAMGQSASGDFSRTMGGMDDQAEDLSANFTKSVEGMGEQIGIDFPEAAETGAERFSRSSEIIHSGQAKISSGLEMMKDMGFKLNQILSTNRLSTFIQAVNMKKLGEIGQGLGNIGTAGRNLTTGFEAQAQELAVSARKTGANMGMTGAALGKFTKQAAGMAFALQIDAGEAGQAIKNFEWAAEQLAAVGIKSATDLAKVSTTTGVSAAELAVSVRRMSQEFKFSDESINKLYGSFTAMGQEMFDVGGSVKKIPEVLDLLRKAALASGQELDEMQLLDFATQTAGAARAFFEFTQDGEQAHAMALQLGQTIVGARKDFRNLFAGVGNDLPGFLTSIGIMSGDINEAFDLMQQGPSGFMKVMSGMVGSAKKSGRFTQDFIGTLAARLEEAVGEDQANQLMTFFRTADASTLEAMSSVEMATTSLGKLGKAGWSSSRTLQESFDMAKDSMIAQFRSIGKSRVQFVKDSAKEFSAFAKSAKKLAAEGGPIGLVITKLSDLHSLGAVGMLPRNLRSIATVFGEVLNEALPLLTMLGAMGFRMKTLLNPLALAGVGFSVLAVQFASAYKAAGPLMKSKKKLEELGFSEDQIKSVTKMDVAFKLLENKLISFVDYVAKWGPKTYNALIGTLLDISNRLLKFADDLDFNKMFGKLFKRLKVKGDISKNIAAFADDVMVLFGDALSGKSSKAKTKLGQVLINLTAAFAKIFKKVGAQLAKIDFFGIFKDAVSGLWSGLTGGMDPKSAAGASSMKRVADAIGRVLSGALGLVKGFIFTTLVPAISDLSSGLLTGLAGGMDPKSASGVSAAEKMGLNIADVTKKAFSAVQTYLKDYFKQWWADVGEIWADPSKSFKLKAQETIGSSGGIIAGGLLAMKVGTGPATKGLQSLSSILMSVIVSIGSMGTLLISLVSNWTALSGALTTAGTALGGVSAGTVALYAGAIAAIAAIAGLAVGFTLWPEETKSALDKIGEWLSGFGKKIGEYVVEWGPTIVYWMTVGIPIALAKNAPAILLAIGKAFSGLHKIIVDLVDGILTGMKDALIKKFPQFASTFTGLFDGLSVGFKWIMKIGSYLVPIVGQLEAIADLVDAWGDETSTTGKWFRDLWDTIKKGFESFMEWISPVTDVLKKVAEVYIAGVVLQFKVLWGVASVILKAIWGFIKIVWEALKLVGYVIYRVIKSAFLLIAAVAYTVWKGIKAVWEGLVEVFSAIWNKVTEAVEYAWGYIKSLIVQAWVLYIKPIWEPIAQWFADKFNALEHHQEGDHGRVDRPYQASVGGDEDLLQGVVREHRQVGQHSGRCDHWSLHASQGRRQEVLR